MEGRKMSKSSLSVLAKAVASKRGLTQAEAERFIPPCLRLLVTASRRTSC